MLITLFILLFITFKPAKYIILIIIVTKSYKPLLKPKKPLVKYLSKSLK
jgi:hypothetical protein